MYLSMEKEERFSLNIHHCDIDMLKTAEAMGGKMMKYNGSQTFYCCDLRIGGLLVSLFSNTFLDEGDGGQSDA